MSRQYTNGCCLEVTAGENVCVELPAPPRGTLERFIVKQTTGTLAGFSYRVLDRKDACRSVEEISNSYEPDADFQRNVLLDWELHQIITEQTVAGGSAADEHFGLNAGYQNRDEQDIRRTPNSRIYLDINIVGTGTKQFQVSYTIEPMTNA